MAQIAQQRDILWSAAPGRGVAAVSIVPFARKSDKRLGPFR